MELSFKKFGNGIHDNANRSESYQPFSFFSGRSHAENSTLTWNSKQPLYKWLFQLDDSKSLHKNWLFYHFHPFKTDCLGFQVVLFFGQEFRFSVHFNLFPQCSSSNMIGSFQDQLQYLDLPFVYKICAEIHPINLPKGIHILHIWKIQV